MKKKILLTLSVLTVVILCIYMFGLKRSLFVTFDGKVEVGMTVYMLSSEGVKFQAPASSGIIELPKGYDGGALSIKILKDEKVLRDFVIPSLGMGKHHYDFSDNVTQYKRSILFYTESTISHDMKTE